jgi:hypothetical protein
LSRPFSEKSRALLTANGVGNVGESGFGIGAQRLDRCQANDNDERQHDSIFDRGRPILGPPEAKASSDKSTQKTFLHPRFSAQHRCDRSFKEPGLPADIWQMFIAILVHKPFKRPAFFGRQLFQLATARKSRSWGA